MLNSRNVYSKILLAFRDQTPLSIIRLGDGETITLDAINSRNKYEKMIKSHLGFIPDDSGLSHIRENLITAFSTSDFIGIPYGHYLESKNRYWKDGIKILQENVKLKEDVRYCSMNLHIDFLTGGILSSLLASSRELFYVSCHNLDRELKQKYNMKTNSFQIAPEMKYFSAYNGPKHYPEQLEEVRKWIEKQDCKNKLCLVGGGIVGKIYTHWFKERGGIAIDIGSAFDRMAGRITRGREKSKIFDNRYKL